ncbi:MULTISPECIES: MCE family protein [Streptomyces]|uniref:ABC transporter substrate-binding protein n=1 Tax=Streptomyces qinglanensis TaxID=943816 RepID=A0A1E7K679_9ACTN|nr:MULTISPECIES: MlaD family protein [Streptomyces]OEU99423.1 ABC transporter substrate-binding protein [Streptomyces qinglanensis]OEV23167.1 ABC transporter substrate-binding protein [Streptomyces nanshensis]
MLTRATVLKNIAFLALAALVLGVIGVRYADVGRYVGLRDYFTVRVELARTGGLYEHADVTYRGVSVGRVGDLDLTDGGVSAELRIRNSAPRIPAGLTAHVANLSAVGEQYLDLRPDTGKGPFLHEGSVIPQPDTTVPAPPTKVLASVDNLVAALPRSSLRTVVDELGETFEGRGDDLEVLLDTGSEFLDAADAAAPETTGLIVDSATVLRTQREEGRALRDFADGAEELLGQLKKSDPDLRRLITATPGAATQVTGLLRDLDPSLSVLLANLTTTAELTVTRARGLEELLVKLPRVAAAGSTAVTRDGASFSMALAFFDPLPCTAGYGDTPYRSGLETGKAPPLNDRAHCASPPSSGKNVRGSANAPTGGPLPEPARPGAYAAGAATAPFGDGDAGPRDMAGLLGLKEER